MKFLFINKPFKIECLGIMYLSSAIKSRGHSTKLVLTTTNLEEKIKNYNPDFIGYSIMTGDQDFYEGINKRLKKKFDFFSIAGGPHPTFFPEMFKKSSFDAFCMGEGEETITDIINNPQRKVYGVKQLIEPLDKIVFPDRELVFNDPKIREGPIKHFIASRGCQFNCSYCFNESYSKLYKGKGKRVRFRLVDNLLDEVVDVVKQSPTRFVYFQDDTFILDKDWVREFSTKYKERIGLPFHCHTRANLVTEDLVNDLKSAGCYSVHVAAEAGSEKIRKEILNRNMSDDQIYNAMRLLKGAGIKTMLQNILGLPFTTLEDDLKTLELNIKCQPDYAWASIFQPYPKTTLGERCVKEGLYTGNFSDLKNNFFDESPLNIPHTNELKHLQKMFAILVKYPNMYPKDKLNYILKIDYDLLKENATKHYNAFRKEADKILYGFDLL